MKLIASLLVLFSANAFSRQYIQCSNLDEMNSTAIVVNLETEDRGTLFITSGMENPEEERSLTQIKLRNISSGFHQYVSLNAQGDTEVIIPSQIINKSSDSLNIELSVNQYSFRFSCFSRIYTE